MQQIPNYSDRTYSMINQIPNEQNDYSENQFNNQFENQMNNQQMNSQYFPQIINYSNTNNMNQFNQFNQYNQMNHMNQSNNYNQYDNEMKPHLPKDRNEKRNEEDNQRTKEMKEKELTRRNLHMFHLNEMSNQQTHNRIENWLNMNQEDAEIPQFGFRDGN